MYYFSFSWLDALFCTGVKRDLQEDDLSLCPEEVESERLYKKFNKYVCGNRRNYPYVSLCVNGIIVSIIASCFDIAECVCTYLSYPRENKPMHLE